MWPSVSLELSQNFKKTTIAVKLLYKHAFVMQPHRNNIKYLFIIGYVLE